ncbi:hypothetical protein [Persicobacter sp. CCB-QB2]|uniref:hypothetical protein n=1 Tax=Persicobacter sp. CCB-QB2 TaxID=1561025 RepID=UPI0006AA00E0|nr:hypothetical protein [Persicobacter sp. CCB-QB2]
MRKIVFFGLMLGLFFRCSSIDDPQFSPGEVSRMMTNDSIKYWTAVQYLIDGAPAALDTCNANTLIGSDFVLNAKYDELQEDFGFELENPLGYWVKSTEDCPDFESDSIAIMGVWNVTHRSEYQPFVSDILLEYSVDTIRTEMKILDLTSNRISVEYFDKRVGEGGANVRLDFIHQQGR